jgi:hypothetical protein
VNWFEKDNWVKPILMTIGVLLFCAGLFFWITKIHGGILGLYVSLVGFLILAAFLWFVICLKFIDSKTLLQIFLIFMLAFSVRYYIIVNTPQQNQWIDLSIYTDGGKLLSNDINPYDFLDKVELRNNLRLDAKAYNSWVGETQERWNYYASSNLPLTLLFLGVIERISSDPLFYRLVFAFWDSLAAVFIVLYVINHWNYLFIMKHWNQKISSSKYVFFVATILAALSPIFLKWGTILPEDKGIQILFMVSALFFSRSKNKLLRIYLGSFLLGASVAFKGLGIFLVPLCTYYAVFESAPITKESFKKKLGEGFLYLFLSGFFALIWFLPFYPHVMNMIIARLSSGVGLPQHGSIWRSLYLFSPDYWSRIKNIVVICFVVLTAFEFIRKRIGLEIVTANILLTFVVLLLTGGSLDRMHIAILLCILLIGSTSFHDGSVLGIYNFVAGIFVLFFDHFYSFFLNEFQFLGQGDTDREYIESLYALSFTVLYATIFLKILAFPKQFKEREGTAPL